MLTFSNDGGGAAGGGGAAADARGGGFGGGMFSGSVGSVTPTADAVTLREHHTFAELPDGNYKPRLDDPRSGSARCSMPTTPRRSPRRWSSASPGGTASRRWTRPRA
jgi:hypothetical protein